jgi:hypothetical protein
VHERFEQIAFSRGSGSTRACTVRFKPNHLNE